MTEHRTASPSDAGTERRRFKRIAFDARTELYQGERHWSVALLDLSLKGLLIARPADWSADTSAPLTADIYLGDEAQVRMQVSLAHEDAAQLGFECTHIELDSISHLRRIIELNLGDPDELDRELGELLRG
jgi:hypothetical protein